VSTAWIRRPSPYWSSGHGFLGRQVVAELLARGKRVHALVRPGSDASVRGPQVHVVGGDILDRASLDPATPGVDAVVTSAAGYTRRRKTDTSDTDLEGNRNLSVADLGATMCYFRNGRFVADPRRQSEVFGPVPTADQAVGRLLRDAGLTPEPQG
jgi:hypothetical protein